MSNGRGAEKRAVLKRDLFITKGKGAWLQKKASRGGFWTSAYVLGIQAKPNNRLWFLTAHSCLGKKLNRGDDACRLTNSIRVPKTSLSGFGWRVKRGSPVGRVHRPSAGAFIVWFRCVCFWALIFITLLVFIVLIRGLRRPYSCGLTDVSVPYNPYFRPV